MAKNDQKKTDRQKEMRGILALRTRKDVNREAAARTQLEFGDTARALQGQLRASAQDSRNINSWYQQYQDQMATLRADQTKAYDTAQANARENAKYLSGQAADRQDAVQTDQDRSAAIRGAVTDPGAAATESAADTQRRALIASGSDRLNAMGYSASSRLGQVNAAADLGRQADQRQERNRRAETRSKMRDLARDKGAARVKNLGDVIRSERDWAIQNRTLKQKDRYSQAMITQAQLGLASAQTSAAATLGAAKLYSGAKVQAARIYNAGNGQKVKGEDVLRAQDYLRAEMGAAKANWKNVAKNKGSWIAQLTSRGADPIAARVAVRRLIRLNTRGPAVGSKAWAKENEERRTGGS